MYWAGPSIYAHFYKGIPLLNSLNPLKSVLLFIKIHFMYEQDCYASQPGPETAPACPTGISFVRPVLRNIRLPRTRRYGKIRPETAERVCHDQSYSFTGNQVRFVRQYNREAITDLYYGGMMMKPKTQNWLNIAQDDYEVAGQLFGNNKYSYCLFFCQQAIEKAIKAIYFERNEEIPPRKHDLVSLAEDTGILKDLESLDGDLLDTLSEYYLESRYAEDRDALTQKCTKPFTENILKKTGVAFEWLKDQLR
jgi:HEPN domain-containing protein